MKTPPAPESLISCVLILGIKIQSRLKKCVIIYHAVSQLEVHNIKAASSVSRSVSADTRTIRNTPDLPALQDASGAAAMDQFQFAQATRLAMKMQSVKEQLNSVLVNTHSLLLLD